MRYIVKANGQVVYDGDNFRKAKRTMLEYAEYGGVTFESRE